MDFDPKQMAAVRAVIQTGSFEQAALQLHLTPSAVSQRVRALESQLGSPLVVRTRPCRATAVGQRLMQYLRRATLLEEDFVNDLAALDEASLTLGIAVNADTLATWFFPVLAEMLVREGVLLDLNVDDQDHTYALLASGQTIGCISTESKAMRGCSADLLAVMRYRLVASPVFASRWFPNGLTRDAARLAPVIASTHKDMLQARFLEARFGLLPGNYPCHYIPVPGPRFSALCHGLGYGMVAELQLEQDLREGYLVDIASDWQQEIALYWHTWQVQSAKMNAISKQIVMLTRKVLS